MLPLFGSNAPYSYSYTPKYLYKNQVFPITVLIKHYNEKEPPNFEFDQMSLLQPIIDKPVIVINKDDAFYTFYFKATSNVKDITVPSLTIWTLKYSYMLNPIEIPLKKLKGIDEKSFSNVIASNLRVNTVKVDTYDSSHNLITLNLDANEANLEDMSIPNVIDDGVENLKRKGSLTTATYYFITSSNSKNIEFTYYNTIKNRFIKKNITFKDKKSSLDTIKLAPKELSFEKIKSYIAIFLTLFFALIYLKYRDIIYLLFFIIFASILIYIYYPKKIICINEGAPLYILPTNNSNISMQIDSKIHKKVLHRYNNFNKIEYKNSITGWIKDEDTCEN